MANEIKVTTKLVISKGFLSRTDSATNVASDQTGDGMVSAVQNIGVSAEAIDLGDVTTPGMAFFRNLDTTNEIEIGQDISAGGFDKFFTLRKGETAVMRLTLAVGGVLQAQAPSGACELQYTIYED